MKRIEIELEHFYQNKFMGRKRLKPNSEMTVIGQTRDCHLRLLGEGVSNLHAVIEFQNDKWTVSDLGSEQGTWIKKKPVVCHELHGPTTIMIGQHSLKVVPKIVESHLFMESDSAQNGEAKKEDIVPEANHRPKEYHQVIVRKNSFVVSSLLLQPNETYTFHGSDKEHVLGAPESDAWVKTEFGDDVVIQQRRVTTHVIEESNKEKVHAIWDPNLKGPMVVALIFLIIFTGLIVLSPTEPDEELEELQPNKNRYAKMIYDAKAIRKRRVDSKKVRNSISQSSTNKMQAPEKNKKQKVAKTQANMRKSKVVKKIRAAGLSRLIGKISKRAAKSAVFIKAAGRSPDTKFTGRAAASVGSMGKAAKGKQYKISSVTTAGKAGGASAYKNVGGLSMGNVGNASVGILEDETEIKGGLDKDIIARVIEKHLGQIRYCYERQLSASPDLYGKVMIKFTIDASGAVVTQNVGKTTLRSAMVEGCILRRVSGWKFPKPRGGTRVLVSYPFLFKSTN